MMKRRKMNDELITTPFQFYAQLPRSSKESKLTSVIIKIIKTKTINNLLVMILKVIKTYYSYKYNIIFKNINKNDS